MISAINRFVLRGMMGIRHFVRIAPLCALLAIALFSPASDIRAGEELKWFNADHAPTGAFSSFVFGMKERGGGFMNTKAIPPSKDIYIAYKSDSAGVRIFPFVLNPSEYNASDFYDDADISRTFRYCSDQWQTPDVRISVYSPIWAMPDPATMDAAQKKLVFCPAQWIEIAWDNSQSSESAEILFGLRANIHDNVYDALGDEFLRGFEFRHTDQERGFLVALTGQAGCQIEAIKYENVLKYFAYGDASSGWNSGAIRIIVPPGSTDHIFLLTLHYNNDVVTDGISSKFYYTELFSSYVDVAAFAYEQAETIKRYCLEQDQKLANSGVNASRQFLIAHSTHTYLANTCYLQSENGPVWVISEGDFQYINTLDLTADMVFYELRMHPWTMRNVLDLWTSRYFYYDQVTAPKGDGTRYPGGISFNHDMGRYTTFTPAGTSDYETYISMAHEELTNWLLCAALYWKATNDDSWLQAKSDIFQDCLESLINRDDFEASQRDGVQSLITTYQDASEEITTYDALDPSLKQPYENLYLAVKTWASYLALDIVLTHLNLPEQAELARTRGEVAAATIQSYQIQDESGVWLPSLFNKMIDARIIPAIEGLIFPYKLGDSDAVSENGRFGSLITLLKNHLEAVMKPGVCLDEGTGAWKISSDTTRTWQSKVYLCQYIAEKIMGQTSDLYNGAIDAIHADLQLNRITGRTCWSEQLFSDTGEASAGYHYPRGVTTSLFWEDVDLANPVADQLVLVPLVDTLKKNIANPIRVEAREAGSSAWDYLTFTSVRLTSNSATLLFSPDSLTWTSELTLPMNMGAAHCYISDLEAEIVTVTTEDLSDRLGSFEQELVIQPKDVVPVELASFSARAHGNQMILSWATVTESNNFGFDVHRCDEQADWVKIGFVRGNGTSAAPHSYTFTDASALAPGVYFYRLKQLDTDGSYTLYPPIRVRANVPERVQLGQNYPNPFNGATIIQYEVPAPGRVTLSIFNVQGHAIRNLVDEFSGPGYFSIQWNGLDAKGQAVSSGNYFYRLTVNDVTIQRQLIVLK
ncbi:MAG: glycoside hydrolase family 52 protein [Candidatus Zhuqueibacterota bacterium]